MHLRRQGRAIEKVGLDFGVPPASFDERIDHLGKLGAGGMPPEEAIAREFNLEVVYARVYRVASDASHYSLSTALQGFDFSAVEGKLEELETLSGIPIRFLDGEPERAAGALALATVVYGTFLERSDFVIKHGVAGDALELLQAHVRSAS
ncbi:MAG TPA: hypothetical protein VFM96_07920 [Gaiellaceae bacterium]|nr:hypothetical protein [Gaiellaceae bacterium]